MSLREAIKERFKSIRKDLNLGQEVFGVNLGTNQVSIAEIESGKKNPNMDILVTLHTKYQVNLNWFICGTGLQKYDYQDVEQLIALKPDNEANSKLLLESQRETIDALKGSIDSQKRTITTLEARIADLEGKDKNG
jgi:transcriptional regulator with XRE-family HTH domain